MVSGRILPIEADLFSTPSLREVAATAASAPRYLLPKDLARAISNLSDQEFDRLLAAVLANQKRRGIKLPVSRKTSHKPLIKEIGPPLTLAKLKAARAAFKAGVAPSRIARQFGISHADVRKALASGSSKRTPDRPAGEAGMRHQAPHAGFPTWTGLAPLSDWIITRSGAPVSA